MFDVAFRPAASQPVRRLGLVVLSTARFADRALVVQRVSAESLALSPLLLPHEFAKLLLSLGQTAGTEILDFQTEPGIVERIAVPEDGREGIEESVDGREQEDLGEFSQNPIGQAGRVVGVVVDTEEEDELAGRAACQARHDPQDEGWRNE